MHITYSYKIIQYIQILCNRSNIMQISLFLFCPQNSLSFSLSLDLSYSWSTLGFMHIRFYFTYPTCSATPIGLLMHGQEAYSHTLKPFSQCMGLELGKVFFAQIKIYQNFILQQHRMVIYSCPETLLQHSRVFYSFSENNNRCWDLMESLSL